MHIKHSFGPELFAVCSRSFIDSMDSQARLYIVIRQHMVDFYAHLVGKKPFLLEQTQNPSPFWENLAPITLLFLLVS